MLVCLSWNETGATGRKGLSGKERKISLELGGKLQWGLHCCEAAIRFLIYSHSMFRFPIDGLWLLSLPNPGGARTSASVDCFIWNTQNVPGNDKLLFEKDSRGYICRVDKLKAAIEEQKSLSISTNVLISKYTSKTLKFLHKSEDRRIIWKKYLNYPKEKCMFLSSVTSLNS